MTTLFLQQPQASLNPQIDLNRTESPSGLRNVPEPTMREREHLEDTKEQDQYPTKYHTTKQEPEQDTPKIKPGRKVGKTM